MSSKKVYNLEERTFRFARDCRLPVKILPKTLGNIEDAKQLIKSSGSVGANYIEANEKLGGKDLAMRLRIARKEAKEAEYWLKLLKEMNTLHKKEIEGLIHEVTELRRILSAIINRIASTRNELQSH